MFEFVLNEWMEFIKRAKERVGEAAWNKLSQKEKRIQIKVEIRKASATRPPSSPATRTASPKKRRNPAVPSKFSSDSSPILTLSEELLLLITKYAVIAINRTKSLSRSTVPGITFPAECADHSRRQLYKRSSSALPRRRTCFGLFKSNH